VEDVRFDVYGLNNIGAKMLLCGKPLISEEHFDRKKRFDRILLSRLEIFTQETVVINFNDIYWG
jgi:hypothetical protein